MTRVLLLVKGLGRGGTQRLLLNAVPHLDRSRFDYEVAYLLPANSALVPELEAAGLEVSCLDGRRGVGWVARLAALVKERRVELVHVHSPYAAVGARLGLSRQAVRLVYTEHNVWASYRPATRYANALTYWRNDHVFAVSDAVRASLHLPGLLRALPRPPVETLYHGHTTPESDDSENRGALRRDLGIPADAPLVGTVANFKPQKGHRYLLGAASLVRRTVPNVRFALIGAGPLEDEIRREVHRLDLDSTVLFAGSRDDGPRVAEDFDVFALASVHEGLPVALLESMAHGTPAVVTSAGGLPEVIEHGMHGFVVPVADEDALAEGILMLLADPPLRERFGQAARVRALDFSIHTAVRRVEDVYAELLG